MDKCKERDCNCQSNSCEWECDSDPDCKDYNCNQDLGYMCKCQKNICRHVKKPTQCKNIDNCIQKGLCSTSEPCDCTQEYCETPWWVKAEGNCRDEKDCESSIQNCRGGKCTCGKFVQLNN